MNIDRFKPIPGFSKYLINEEGEIYSLFVNRLLKSHINSTGRWNIKLIDDHGISTNILIHRLLAFVFLGLPSLDSSLEVDHKNTNELDYSLNNLQVLDKSAHLDKTLKDRGYTARPKCSGCGCAINKDNVSGLCKKCKPMPKSDITVDQIEYWVCNYSWTRASKELGLSDNGLRKRYTKLTDLSPKNIARGTARCGHFALNEE